MEKKIQLELKVQKLIVKRDKLFGQIVDGIKTNSVKKKTGLKIMAKLLKTNKKIGLKEHKLQKLVKKETTTIQ